MLSEQHASPIQDPSEDRVGNSHGLDEDEDEDDDEILLV